MAYRLERETGDIVIDGFEQGMADSAELGISLMKNVNITTSSKEVMVNLGSSALTAPPTISADSCTFAGATDIITSASAIAQGLFNNCAVFFGSSTGGVTAGVPYYVGNISGNTFKIYDHISRGGAAVNITDDTNTISTFVIGAMTHHAESWTTNAGASPAFSPYNLLLDANGRAWFINSSNQIIFMGNTTLTATDGNGLAVIGGSATAPGYLLVFRRAAIDYITLDAITNTTATAGQWTYGWQTPTGYAGISHQAFYAPSFNGVIFCNGAFAGTIIIPTSTTFDPGTASTYTYNASALAIPTQDRCTWIDQLGTTFLIGGIQTRIYPWDGISPSYNAPLVIPEPNVQKIICTNSNGYIFAGTRGRIYLTNGSSVQEFRKFPDQISGAEEPYWTWGGALYWRNQLIFGIQNSTNAGVAINNTGGAWAIDLSSDALRHINDAGGSTVTCPVIAPIVSSSTPGGIGIYISSTATLISAWNIYRTLTTPYTSGETIVRPDLIPVGLFYTGRSFSQVEYKLSRPLVAGESVAIEWRPDLAASFTSLTSDSTQVGAMSGVFVSNIDPSQYIQLQLTLTSTLTTPSYVRLTEIRIR